MRISRRASFVMIFIAAVAGSGRADAQSYRGPKCLGPVCFDNVSAFQSLSEQLGGPSSSGGIYGYRDKDGKTSLIITEGDQGRIGSIGLRDFSQFGQWTEKDGVVTTQNIRNWKTPEGIGLGSSEADVTKAYGPPSGVKDLQLEDGQQAKGKRLLVYKGKLSGRLRSSGFRIRDGRVSFIELENDAFVGPDCLGPFCTYGDVPFDAFLKHLDVPPQKTARSIECYRSRDGRASLHFATNVEETLGIADFLLSDFQNCMHRTAPATSRNMYDWKTPEGIGLGSSEQDVVRAYGEPTSTKTLNAQKPINEIKGLLMGRRSGDESPRIADKLLIYGPRELQQVDFGIRDGKVSYIWLKESDSWLKASK